MSIGIGLVLWGIVSTGLVLLGLFMATGVSSDWNRLVGALLMGLGGALLAPLLAHAFRVLRPSNSRKSTPDRGRRAIPLQVDFEQPPRPSVWRIARELGIVTAAAVGAFVGVGTGLILTFIA